MVYLFTNTDWNEVFRAVLSDVFELKAMLPYNSQFVGGFYWGNDDWIDFKN